MTKAIAVLTLANLTELLDIYRKLLSKIHYQVCV